MTTDVIEVTIQLCVAIMDKNVLLNSKYLS